MSEIKPELTKEKPVQHEVLTNELPLAGGGLRTSERYWRSQYRWLQSVGYQLRPRYNPDWVPSWYSTSKTRHGSEDSCKTDYPRIIDAIRIQDGTQVILKKVNKDLYPYELDIIQQLSSGSLKSDRNHSVPLLAVIAVPDSNLSLLVMPILRNFDDPRFDTFGEVVEFFRQIFEGLQFLHQNHIAHRDCKYCNIMMDGSKLFPNGFHPFEPSRNINFRGAAKHFTRTQRPPRYYLIDFGLSRQFKPDDANPGTEPIEGGDRTVPEFRNYQGGLINPFPTDVYYAGNMIREQFMMKRVGFDFMRPLVADMVQSDPSKRPSMDEVVARYEDIRKNLSSRKLRSRVYERWEHPVVGIYRSVAHWTRRVIFIVKRVPAVPSA